MHNNQDNNNESKNSQRRPEKWPTKPSETSPNCPTPPPPTMDDIQDAFAESTGVTGTGQTSQATDNSHAVTVASIAHVTADNDNASKPHSATIMNGANLPLPPSRHVPFMGYVDEDGILHKDNLDTSLKGVESADNNNGNKKRAGEADKKDSPISAEDVLQASLQFDRSHPENRFSSSLDHYYSSSTRQLYPSVDGNVGHRPVMRTQSQDSSNREDEGTTCADVLASAAHTSAAMATTNASAQEVVESVVPEPPGTEAFALTAAAYKSDDNEEDDDDVKIGPSATIRAQANISPTPAYAVAAVDNSNFASAEATVLGTSESREEALLAKLAAEDELLVAMKRSMYNGGGGEGMYNGGSAAGGHYQASYPDQEATVVAITEHDVHPSDMSNDAVAELIGEDFNTVAAFASTPSAYAGAPAAAQGVATPNYDSAVAASPHVASMASETHAVWADDEPSYAVFESEATVVDNGQGWHTGYSEEATVIDNEDSSVPYDERKLPADERISRGRAYNDAPSSRSGTHAVAVAQRDSSAVTIAQNEAEIVGISEERYSSTGEYINHEDCAFADEQAEVVGISEEYTYHPAEVSGNEAEAELVGEDYSASAVAVLECQNNSAEATALPVEADEGLQAATVVGYEDEDGVVNSPGISRASSCGTPVPERITSNTERAHSAPSAVGTRIDPVGTPLTQATELDTVVEEDWMRTPSFRGGAPEVMQPPMDGEQEGQAVAVASLHAYASAPTPAFDETDCHAVAAASSSQPAIAVAALDAFVDAPVPAIDETDCRLVNRRPVAPEISVDTTRDEHSGEEPAMPPPRSFNSIGGASDAGSVGSTASMSTSTKGGFQKISSGIARGMELLFGDTKLPNGKKGQGSNASLAKSVLPRELLPWSVIYSEPTKMWVATVNTNQKALDSKDVVAASNALRAFSVLTEQQATCLAKAWSPPRMHAFSENPACHICRAKFAVFRRACHCRNCGVAVCSSSSCSRPWPAKMCPETYNIKKESFLNVCAACDFLCTNFRLALLEGDRDKAVALHATGNINVVTPFANVKGELFYPVHCAALGGNLDLLKWLIDENCCPIKSVRVSGRNPRDSSNSFTEISTSKGRSLLGIALENRNVGIVRYLVVEKGIQLSGEKDITMDTLCRNLDLVLRLLPEDAAIRNGGNGADVEIPASLLSDEQAPNDNVRGLDTASDGSVSDACIICFAHSIDCVATPCGHQVCCLECSTNISRCPVCAIECTFMRVFRP